MPFVNDDSSLLTSSTSSRDAFLDLFTQILEFVALLHTQNIAFIDISSGNILYSTTGFEYGQFRVSEKTIYFIDFGSARQFATGPGNGAVVDFAAVTNTLPEGPNNVDPYACDIYGLGMLLSTMIRRNAAKHPEVELPLTQVIPLMEKMTSEIPENRPSIVEVQREWYDLLMSEGLPVPSRTAASARSGIAESVPKGTKMWWIPAFLRRALGSLR
ncbi:hypothetical protein BXZ70DRAFT_210027 [Cristinia sonorae]|uniref:Protein kinase domain-containing protein n=1 Tax=Cristinia sonorae TaxID=1940300 RepID=A0A8K0UPZ0_9AGAR|nr:hypothetical protein BXZ70DRAFT_210027 [Cristinia sonorae]